ncbi:MAG: phosphoribosyl-AMP cyclohydrolase [Candidatus Hadarchaeales archaeon]
MSESEARELLRSLKFRDGLVTAVVRDWRSKEILMVAHQNREAVMKTLTTGLMHYWSVSRGRLWLKGETSGHLQALRGVCLDCDGDSILYDVQQKVAACHEGYYSCFFRTLRGGRWVIFRKKKFEPSQKYKGEGVDAAAR